MTGNFYSSLVRIVAGKIQQKRGLMIVQCCVCKKIRQEDNSWKIPVKGERGESHAYCPICKTSVLQEIKKNEEQA